jgi:hypothetical protein
MGTELTSVKLIVQTETMYSSTDSAVEWAGSTSAGEDFFKGGERTLTVSLILGVKRYCSPALNRIPRHVPLDSAVSVKVQTGFRVLVDTAERFSELSAVPSCTVPAMNSSYSF